MSAAAVVIGALRVKTTKCTKAIKNMLSHFLQKIGFDILMNKILNLFRWYYLEKNITYVQPVAFVKTCFKWNSNKQTLTGPRRRVFPRSYIWL